MKIFYTRALTLGGQNSYSVLSGFGRLGDVDFKCCYWGKQNKIRFAQSHRH